MKSKHKKTLFLFMKCQETAIKGYRYHPFDAEQNTFSDYLGKD